MTRICGRDGMMPSQTSKTEPQMLQISLDDFVPSLGTETSSSSWQKSIAAANVSDGFKLKKSLSACVIRHAIFFKKLSFLVCAGQPVVNELEPLCDVPANYRLHNR